MSKTTKTIIISAFPGSGKTTFAKKFKGRVLDLESSDFKWKSSRDAGEYEDKTGIVAKPIKVNPNGYNEDKKPVFSSKEIDDFIKGAIKDMNNLMTQEAHSTEDKKVTVMDDSVDDEKDKPISTPEEFINYVEGLFEI